MHIVEYQYPDMGRAEEKEFTNLLEAIQFTDACVEEGGTADLYVDGPIDTLLPQVLARLALLKIVANVYPLNPST